MIMLSAPRGVTRIAGANAYAAKLATSPTIIVIMPTHHSGSYRYEYPPAPALTPEAPAFFSPFFLTMKLAPMKTLEDNARTNPLTLSDDIPLYASFQLCDTAAAVAVAAVASNAIKHNLKPSSSSFSSTTASFPNANASRLVKVRIFTPHSPDRANQNANKIVGSVGGGKIQTKKKLTDGNSKKRVAVLDRS
nr:hypothetical protein BHM03_00024964 [Ipomoea batatas]